MKSWNLKWDQITTGAQNYYSWHDSRLWSSQFTTLMCCKATSVPALKAIERVPQMRVLLSRFSQKNHSAANRKSLSTDKVSSKLTKDLQNLEKPLSGTKPVERGQATDVITPLDWVSPPEEKQGWIHKEEDRPLPLSANFLWLFAWRGELKFSYRLLGSHFLRGFAPRSHRVGRVNQFVIRLVYLWVCNRSPFGFWGPLTQNLVPPLN